MEPRISSLVTETPDDEDRNAEAPSSLHTYGPSTYAKPSPVEPSVVKASSSSSAATLLTESVGRGGGYEVFPLRPEITSPSYEGFAAPPNAQIQKSTKGDFLAEVLNKSPVPADFPDESSELSTRKRPMLDDVPGNDFFTLPKPKTVLQRRDKRLRIPPLLQGLHQPPPDAGLFPPISADSFDYQLTEFEDQSLGDVDRPFKAAGSWEYQAAEEIGSASSPGSVQKGKRRNKWTDQETSDLLKGVARFGIGKWKLILQHEDYHFNNRTAVDLKDRFRTCTSGDTGTSSWSPKGSANLSPTLPSGDTLQERFVQLDSKLYKITRESDSIASSKDRRKRRAPRKSDPTNFGVQGPFPQSTRRERRRFTEQEDQALLKGFEKYGTLWHKIRDDPDLQLDSRSATDLRDRFRNKYPTKFEDSGHHIPKRKKRGNRGNDENRDDLSNLSGQQSVSAGAASQRSAQNSPASPPLPTTMPSAADPIRPSRVGQSDSLTNYESIRHNLPSPITLDRSIFDWADKNLAQSGASDPSYGTAVSSEMLDNPRAAFMRSSRHQMPGIATTAFQPLTPHSSDTPQPKSTPSTLPPIADLTQEPDARPEMNAGQTLWDDDEFYKE